MSAERAHAQSRCSQSSGVATAQGFANGPGKASRRSRVLGDHRRLARRPTVLIEPRLAFARGPCAPHRRPLVGRIRFDHGPLRGHSVRGNAFESGPFPTCEKPGVENMLGHAPPPLAGFSLDMRGGHPAAHVRLRGRSFPKSGSQAPARSRAAPRRPYRCGDRAQGNGLWLLRATSATGDLPVGGASPEDFSSICGGLLEKFWRNRLDGGDDSMLSA